MFHREGFLWISATTFFLLTSVLAALFIESLPWLWYFLCLLSFVLWVLVLQFFRNPSRIIPKLDDSLFYAPADGKIVVIEEVEEVEFFKEKRLQVSIFMSPLNVHVNRHPFCAEVIYTQHHPGLYLVAWHPKSSTENERHTVVYRRKDGTEVLVRQIAGALARRICNYTQVGQQAKQGEDMGFIKFGSRVDMFFPLGTKLKIEMNQMVSGNLTCIAEMPIQE